MSGTKLQNWPRGIREREREETGMMIGIRIIRTVSAPSPPVPLNLFPSALLPLLIYKY